MAGGDVDMVTIPRAELEAMQAELRRLRDALDDEIARSRIMAYRGPQPGDRLYTLEELAEAWGIRE